MKTKQLLILFVCIFAYANTYAANRYWVTSVTAGNWADASSWSATSGGAGGASVPTSTDDVFFVAGGATTVTLGAAITVKSITFTSRNVTFVQPSTYSITTTNMTVNTSQVVFANTVNINTALTFSGTTTAPRITHTTTGNFQLGNGGAFTLTGNSTTNYFAGSSSSSFRYNTTSALTVFFKAPSSIGGIYVYKGLITLGNDLTIVRLNLPNNSNYNQELILGANVTLTLASGGTSGFSADPNGGTVNASASGSKFIIQSQSNTVLDGSIRIFKTGKIINHFEFNSVGITPETSTFVLFEPIRVRTLTKTAGTINNTTNSITVEAGGSVVEGAGSTTASVITETPVTRYWVGGAAGNWLNAASWGTSSGNTSTPGIPAYGDNVVFDNSTGNENPTVTLTETHVAAADITFTSSNVTFAGAFGITTPTMTVNSSQVVFVDNVTVNSALTFSGTDPRISEKGLWGKMFTLGNGGAFTLTGHSATNYFGGNTPQANSSYGFNTDTPLTVYFDPSTSTPLTLGGITVTKGLITLGNDVRLIRLVLTATNSQELILAPNVTLSYLAGGTGALTATAGGGVVNASASGSKVIVSTANAVPIDGTKRFFKTGTIINHFEFGSATKTFNLFEPLTVKNLTLTDGTINNSTNNITIDTEGAINRTSGLLSAAPVFTGAINVNIGGTTSISGNELLGTTGHVGTLTVNDGANYTLNAGSTVDGLIIAPGAQVTNSSTLTATNLTINSNVTGTGTFIDNGTSTITNAVVKQYLGTTRNWYVSSPVESTASSTSNITSYFEYIEAGNNNPAGQPTNSSAYWKGYTPGATFMTAGKGYIALPTNPLASIQFNGTLNKGDVNVTLSKVGNGFNLIGNPYPSHLTWTEAYVTSKSAQIEPTIWIRTNSGSSNSNGWSFTTHNALVNESSPFLDVLIAPMQAFWVKAKVAGPLTLDNTLVRSHDTSNRLKAPAAKNIDRQRVRLQVSNGTTTDEALLYFDAAAANTVDDYDSPKYMANSTVTQIYTTVGDEKLVINGMNTLPLNQEIGLGFIPGNANSFSIIANEISNLASNVKVILKDNVTLAETDLSDGITAYQFSPATSAGNRFSVIFRSAGVSTGIDNTTKLNSQVFVNASNQITIITPEKCNYAIYNAVGLSIENGITTSNYQTSNIKLAAGVYVVKVANVSKRIIIK